MIRIAQRARITNPGRGEVVETARQDCRPECDYDRAAARRRLVPAFAAGPIRLRPGSKTRDLQSLQVDSNAPAGLVNF
jgi:hypothetical protein